MQVVLQEQAPGQMVVSLDGELDMATAPDLIDAVVQAVDGRAVGELVVDLGKLHFLDSSGVQALVRVRQLAQHASATFAVHRPRQMVAHVLDVAGVAELLGVVAAAEPERPGTAGR